ncbi:MAG: hypothetical protein IKS17_02030 [Firmicutes bacterium]|nr:hypothetical protein [Bacillota bacterium]
MKKQMSCPHFRPHEGYEASEQSCRCCAFFNARNCLHSPLSRQRVT